MRTLVPAALVLIAGASLAAQTTGRLAGKVTNTAGKPIANVSIKISRTDINWSKSIKIDPSGAYMQAGLDPKFFNMEISAEGYVTQQKQIKIPLGDVHTENVVLMTQEEAIKANPGVVAADPGAGLEAKAAQAFNEAVGLVNAQKFGEALPLLETATQDMQESLAKSKDEKLKADINDRLGRIEKVYAISLFEVGSSDEAQRKDLWAKAEPLILKLKALEPKEERYPSYLARIAEFKGDAAAAKAYEAEAEAIVGPRPEKAYNAAVEAFNKGDMAATKKHCERAITIDPKDADAHYLLAMAEFSNGNLKGTKVNFQKYLELAPTGKHAAEVAEMLKDPSLKNIK